MDLADLGHALDGLNIVEIRLIARDLADAKSSIADEIATTRSVLRIEHTLRRTHRLHNAATAALSIATTVQEAAQRDRIDLPDDDVTRVARSAAQLARGLVAARHPGVDDALRCLGRGWHRVPCLAALAA